MPKRNNILDTHPSRGILGAWTRQPPFRGRWSIRYFSDPDKALAFMVDLRWAGRRNVPHLR